MFEVYEQWRVPIPPIFDNPGAASYKCVRIMLNMDIFIVE
ncbi:hypothetical protein GeomeDRAFT_3349, partial [Geobacter metallireducens RCH3]